MSNQDFESFYKRGNTATIVKTDHGPTADYCNCVVRFVQAEENVGVLVQVELREGDSADKPLLFMPFGTTTFGLCPPGLAKFGQITPATRVIDLDAAEAATTMGEFYPGFFDELRAAQAAATAAATAAAAVAPPPAAQQTVDWTRVFPVGTVFQVGQTTNPSVARCVGQVFRVVDVTNNGMTAVGQQGAAVPNIYIAFDGATELTTNPSGNFSFPSGVGANQQVWNTQTSSYMVYEDFYPCYAPYYAPPAVITYDPWAVPVCAAAGFVVGAALASAAYDPYYYSYSYYDPYDPWYYW